MPDRCIATTCGMYCTRSHERSSVRMKMMLGLVAAAFVLPPALSLADSVADCGGDCPEDPLQACTTSASASMAAGNSSRAWRRLISPGNNPLRRIVGSLVGAAPQRRVARTLRRPGGPRQVKVVGQV